MNWYALCVVRLFISFLARVEISTGVSYILHDLKYFLAPSNAEIVYNNDLLDQAFTASMFKRNDEALEKLVQAIEIKANFDIGKYLSGWVLAQVF